VERSYSSQYRDLWRRHWWWVSRHRLVLEKVSALLPAAGPGRPAASLLDIGCAGGVAFDDLSRFGEVYGLEPDPLLYESAGRWRGRIEPAAFDGAYAPPRAYDLVLMLDVLEHIADDAAAVGNLYRLLRPGGHVLLTVPALPGLWSAHDEANHHYRRYRARGLRRLLAGAGFEVAELRYAYFWSLGLVYLRRWLARPPAGYSVRIPPALVNAPCRWLSRLEEVLLRLVRRGPPLGSSLLALARKPLAADRPAPRAA
jgi:SAM-dependent methyltransferase